MNKGNKNQLSSKNIELYLNSHQIIKGRCFVSSIDKGIESKNYFISVGDKSNIKFILKIYSSSNVEELKYELDILNTLNSSVKSKYFPVIEKSIFYINKKPAVLLKYISGHILSKKEISSNLIKKIAKKQAEMHILFAKYTSKYRKNRYSIFDFSFVDRYIDNDQNLYYDMLHNELIKLKQSSKFFKKVALKSLLSMKI